jgi:hypothetical protein
MLTGYKREKNLPEIINTVTNFNALKQTLRMDTPSTVAERIDLYLSKRSKELCRRKETFLLQCRQNNAAL